MKLAKYVKRVKAAQAAKEAALSAALEAQQRDELRAALEHGDLSETAIAVQDAADRSADYARELVDATSAARETDSDAVELADLESRFQSALEGIKMGNAAGGFTADQFQWAQRALNAILLPVNVKIELEGASMEALSEEGGKTLISLENIEQVIEVIDATRQDIEAGSVDGILRVLDVLEKAIPDVKDRLVALHQSIRSLSYNEELEIRLDDEIFKALAVNGQLPVGWKEYFAGYLNFANAILSSYSDNALESASKAPFLADALSMLGENDCPIKAVSKAIDEIGDPRKKIDSDKLQFVLPGSGPLFGNKLTDLEEEEDVPALFVADVETPQGGEGNGTVAGTAVVAGTDDSVIEPEVPAIAEEPAPVSEPGAPVVAPTAAPASEPTAEPAAATASEEAGTPSVTVNVTEPTPAPTAPAPAPTEPVSEEPTAPAVEPTSEPTAEPASVPTEGEPPAVTGEPSPETEEEEEEEEEEGAATESFATGADNQISPVEALVQKLEKFTTNFAALDPLSWDDRPDAEGGNPTIRVLSKDTIEDVLGNLIKAMEIVNIKSFGESHRQTWASSRAAFGAYKKAFENLTPQQAADISPATEAVGEYLGTVFELSAWPALHVLANLVFTANAFLLLAERSISGQSAEEEVFDPEAFGEDDSAVDGLPSDVSDAEAAAAAQADNDAQAGARAADVGPAGDASVTSST
jgi:hypothetical protein